MMLFTRVVLGMTLAALLAHLLFGENPFSGGVAERVAEGKIVRPVDYARTYGWWVAGANALLVAGLLLTLRRWIGPRTPAAAAAPPSPGGWAPRWFALGVLGAMLVAALLAWPRLTFSLWDDEQYMVRHSVDGLYRKDGTGALYFHRVHWRDTFLYTLNRPANHVPMAILSRLSLATWRAVARPELRFADERAVRLPAWVAGVGAVGATALLLRRMGFAAAGVFAAWLLALHPWHLRYASEARGYSLLLLLLPLLLIAMLDVLQRGSWRRWGRYGLAQVLLLWTYPGAVALLAVVNGVAAIELWRSHRGTAGVREQGARWLVTNLVSAGAWAQLMLPNVLMFILHHPWPQERFRMGFLLQTGSHLWVGTAWAYGRLGEYYAELCDFALAWPGFFRLALASSVALLLLGVARLLAGRGVRALLVAVLILPAPIMALGAWSREAKVYEWYFIFALPSLAMLLAIGVASLFAWVRRPGIAATLGAAAMGLYLAGYAWISHAPRTALRSVSIQPTREAVALTRPSRDPFAPENREITTVSWSRTPFYYDPLVHQIASPEQLLDLLEQAKRTGRPLYVNYGRTSTAQRRHPELVALAEREDLFEEVAVLYGFEPRGHMRVYRYRGRGP
jgi:hypothetical protein